MWAQRRHRSLRVLAPLAAAAMLTAGLVSTTTSANAAPALTVEQVKAELVALDMAAANANEMLNGTKVRLAQLNTQIAAIKASMAQQQALVVRSGSAVDDIARAAYTGDTLGGLAQVLTSNSPQQFLDRTSFLGVVAQSEDDAARAAASSRLALAAQQAALSQDLAIAADASNDASSQRVQIAASIAGYQQLLGSLQKQEQERIQAEAAAARNAEVTAARALSASLAAAIANASTPAGGIYGARAQIAVQYMLSQVGGTYSLNAQPPATWDCSKLTAYAWAQAGVTLTPYSFSQYAETDRVSVDQLEPGDLLFFFKGGAHHVEMYIGGGKAVSASSPSVGVELQDSPLTGWGAEHFSGAGRVRLGTAA